MIRDPRLLVAIVAGGFIGTVLRALTGELLPHDPAEWPWATFLVNVCGAGLLGYVATGLRTHPRPPAYRGPFLATGLCGGLTTFSTLQVELLDMFDAGAAGLGVAYLLASCTAGLLAVWGTSRIAASRGRAQAADA